LEKIEGWGNKMIKNELMPLDVERRVVQEFGSYPLRWPRRIKMEKLNLDEF